MTRVCYLSELGDCSGRLVFEHPVPASYLIDFVHGGSTLRFVGGPKRQNCELESTTVGAKIVCAHHSSSLNGSIDRTLLRLLRHHEPPFTSTAAEFSADEVVAGITKMAFGILYASAQEKKIPTRPLVRSLAELVVGRRSVEDHRLYLTIRESSLHGKNSAEVLAAMRIEVPLQLVMWGTEDSAEAFADRPTYEGVELRFWHGVGLLVWFGDKAPSSAQQDTNDARVCAVIADGFEYSVGRDDCRIKTRFMYK